MVIRKVSVKGTISAVDDDTIGDDHGDKSIDSTAFINENSPSDLVKSVLIVDDEVRVELDLTASMSDGNVVQISGFAKLFEGDTGDSNDLEDQESIDLRVVPDVPLEHKIHLINSGVGGGDTADIVLTFTNEVGNISSHSMPPSVEAADADLPTRRANLLRAWGMNFRLKEKEVTVVQDGEEKDIKIPPGEFTPWVDHGKIAMRHIAAGMAIFADSDEKNLFTPEDWAYFSGLNKDELRKDEHRKQFVTNVENYFDQQVTAFTEMGTDLEEKDGPHKDKNGDYDFLLRDVIALIHIFLDKPDILTNRMIRKLIGQNTVSFSESGDSCPLTGAVPFAGQNLDEWLAEGPDGRHYFKVDPLPVSIPLPLPVDPIPILIRAKVSTPETENHLLGIYAWRFLVNEYLTYVSLLAPDHERFDPCLKALVDSDPERYINNPATFDWVLQLLGRIPHSGLFETNGQPYQSYSMMPVMALYQAAGQLFPADPQRQKIRQAAQNALDYLAAEFTFQSFEGKRMSPFRRNMEKKSYVSFYAGDYAVNVFGILTGAYVFPDAKDDKTGPYYWKGIDQQGGFALWSLLSGYEVPKCIHDLMLNKHSGYFARIQTRYSKSSYPINQELAFVGIGLGGEAATPEIARPRYFQEVSSGQTSIENYDVAGPGAFTPVTQLYFATPSYLNSAGGQTAVYYPLPKAPKAIIDAILLALTPITGPFVLGLRGLVIKTINNILAKALEKMSGSDTQSRREHVILSERIIH